MPNHFHLALWPRKDGELGTWLQWLLTTHVRRYHRHDRSSGHVWQGRFNRPATDKELQRLRHSVQRGCPFGVDNWVRQTAADLGGRARVMSA